MPHDRHSSLLRSPGIVTSDKRSAYWGLFDWSWMDQPLEQTLDLREYLAILRARKWTIALTAALVIGSAMFFSVQQTPIYSATTRLLVRGVPTDSSGYIKPINLQTEAAVVASEQVASDVASDLALSQSSDSLIGSLTVSPVDEEAEVLAISFTTPDPDLAASVANAFATSYIDFKRTSATEALETGRQAIQDRVDSTRRRLEELSRQLNTDEVKSSPDLLSTLETERSIIIARLGVLQQRLDDFEITRPIDLAGGQVIEPARVPLTPVSPNHTKNGLLAVFLGIALGVGLAFLRERLDDRFRGRADVIRTLETPVLALIPRATTPRGASSYTLASSVDPRGRASEAYRSMRTGIEFISSQRGIKSFVITSPSPGEGKTVTTANLGVTLAQAGKKVILVSADLRRPALEKYFGVEREPGLSTWLSATSTELSTIIHDPGINNLRIVPSGAIPPNPAELLSSERLGELIEGLQANADYVIFDSPPIAPLADPIVLAARLGHVLLVIDATKTHRSAGVRAREELERVGARLIGVILNSFDPSASAYYSYDYYVNDYYYEETASGNGSPTDADKPRRSLLPPRR